MNRYLRKLLDYFTHQHEYIPFSGYIANHNEDEEPYQFMRCRICNQRALLVHKD